MNLNEYKEIPANNFQDKMEPGAFIGATLIASGIENSAIIYHGYLGCNIESIHMRSDSIPGGFYTPIIATGLNESDSVYGGFDKLKETLIDVSKNNYDFIWIINGDATSITADDIHGVANSVQLPSNTKVLALDVPGFLGGIAKGTDIAICKLLELSQKNIQNESLCLLAPHLMGIKSHPQDIVDIFNLLKQSGIPVESIVSNNLNKDQLNSLLSHQYYLPLTWENLADTNNILSMNQKKFLASDSVLPIGVSNTEEWLLNIANIFNCPEKAKLTLQEEEKIVKKQLKYNYNYSWLSTLYNDKTCSIYGNAQFVLSLARCFYYDFNIKPKLLALLFETPEAYEKSKPYLEELAQYIDFQLLLNPDYYTYIKAVKNASVDFAIGAVQDKPLCVSEGIPHLSLSGYYFFNNYNFIPWPYMGIKGILSILTELGFLMEKAFYYEKYWQNYKYTPNNKL